MKKILMSLALIAMTAAAAGGATWAYFSSQKVLGSNTITTGNLVINLNDGADKISSVEIPALAPGDVTPEMSIEIENDGSTNLAWVAKFLLGGNEDLQKKMVIKEMKMEFFKPTSGTWEPTDQFITEGRGSGAYPGYYNTLADSDDLHKITMYTWVHNYVGMMPPHHYFEGALKPDYKYKLSFKLEYDKSATIQESSFSLGFQANATQVDKEALMSMLNSLSTPISDSVATSHMNWLNLQLAKQP